MIALLLLAILNILLFAAAGIFMYFNYIKNKVQLDKNLDFKELSKLSKLQIGPLILLPSKYAIVISDFLKKFRELLQPTKGNLAKDLTPGKLLILNASILLIAYNLNTFFKIPYTTTIVIAIVFQVAVIGILTRTKRKIKENLEKKLPEILETVARVYRIHTDLRTAFTEAARGLREDEVRLFLIDLVRRSRFGYTLEESLQYAAREVNSPDFDFAVTSITMNLASGGDIASLLEQNAMTLRKRRETVQEIDSVMFQTKASALISALIVPVICLYAFTTNKQYAEVLLHNSTGRIVFISSLIWWFIGLLLIRMYSRVYL